MCFYNKLTYLLTWFLGTIRVYIKNCMSISSTILAQFTDEHTNTHTDHHARCMYAI